MFDKNRDAYIAYINTRIKNEICYDTINMLSDEQLLPIYKKCFSVKNAIKRIENTLDKFVNNDTKQKIINDYLLQLIPAGTKGVCRGNKFNEIVKEYILKLNLSSERFEICFEKNCDFYLTSEKPDWYIVDKTTNKVLIGMNQLDLWGGGQQINRGFKYITESKQNEKSKLLCIVCNEIQLSSNKNKVYKLFEIGFKNDTLCYIKNLENIINLFFN